jgi:signal transduction histidine kinase
MNLKTRLAAMMVLGLVAVVAVQFVLAERERRELAAQLAQLSGELDRSTAFFVERVHAMSAKRIPEDMQALLAGLAPDTTGGGGPRTTVRVLVYADSTGAHGAVAMPPRGRFETGIERIEYTHTQRDTVVSPTGQIGMLWVREETRTASGDTALQRRLRTLQRSLPAGPGGDRDLVVNLPLPAAGDDSLYSVQMRYSYASLAEELSQSRQRSVVWLAALLALGVAAAIAVAGQFTRPIRALEASFARVQAGDLSTRVQPQRRDEIGHLTASFNDMVARLRESQQISARLAQTEHLASIGRLAAGVAHEVRNPLNAILLNLQQMRDRVERAAAPAAEFDKYHQRIVSEIERLDHLVSGVLDLAKTGELCCEPVDVLVSLRAAVELFRPLAQARGVQVELETPPALPAEADPRRLPAIWNNLLANALDATARGGRIDVRAAAADDSITVTIADDGAGIPAALQARVWEPFHSGREGGTGLGLAIVRAAVEAHGGSIALESAPGAGTRVHVRLPRRPVPAEAR